MKKTKIIYLIQLIVFGVIALLLLVAAVHIAVEFDLENGKYLAAFMSSLMSFFTSGSLSSLGLTQLIEMNLDK